MGPAVYENRIQVTPVSDTDYAFLEWSMDYWARSEADATAWKAYFDGQIPVWADSLRRHMSEVT